MPNPRKNAQILLTITTLCVGCFGFFMFALAQTASDAIAIRVLPNPKHLKPSRWYAEQRFTGSPQELTVDGYDAIRDGDVVYVNAANILEDFSNVLGGNGFEADTESFIPYQPVFNRTNVDSHAGSYSIETSGIYRNLPVQVVGQTYTLSFWAKSISGSKSGIVSVQDGLGKENCLSFTLTLGNTWQKYSRTCTLSGIGNNKSQPMLIIYTPGGAGIFRIDETKLETSDANTRSMYTNIYAISFNQGAEKSTSDIFGQILQFWKFNTNITSNKSAITRDTRRLADLSELNTYLANYRAKNGNVCPTVAQGSYVPNHSISVWPSWQGTLGKDMGVMLPTDPINTLGICRPDDAADNLKYNATTCWDALRKIFAVTVKPAPPYSMTLPQNSLAYSYIASSDGKYCAFSINTENGLACESSGKCKIGNGGVITSGALPLGTEPNSIAISCGNAQIYPNQKLNSPISISSKDSALVDSSVSAAFIGPDGGIGAANLKISKNFGDNDWWSLKTTHLGAIGKYKIAITARNMAGTVKTVDCNLTILGACGDSAITSPEVCDSGSSNTNTPCVAGYGQTCTYCDTHCLPHSVVGSHCGDNVINGPEGCDNGSANTNTPCVAGYGQTCSYCNVSCQPQVKIGPKCGDGVLTGVELCDDNNNNNGDGCSASCTVETNFSCSGSPSVCTGNSQLVNCASKPSNSVWNISSTVTQTWNGSSWLPANSTSYSATPGNCTYICASTFSWDGTVCQPTRTMSCTNPPANTQWNATSSILQTFNGSVWLPSNTSTYGGAFSPCVYSCQSGFIWDGTVCQPTRTVNCSNKPANSSWNGGSTINQVWNGASWLPSNLSVYSMVAGNCKYKCNAGFTWDGSTCAPPPPPPPAPFCGDGTCNNGETSATCIADCPHTAANCAAAGGSWSTVEGKNVCLFSGLPHPASCPAGWNNWISAGLQPWLQTSNNTCTGLTITRAGNCGVVTCTGSSISVNGQAFNYGNIVYAGAGLRYNDCSGPYYPTNPPVATCGAPYTDSTWWPDLWTYYLVDDGGPGNKQHMTMRNLICLPLITGRACY